MQYNHELFDLFRDKDFWKIKARVLGLKIQMTRKLSDMNQDQFAHYLGVAQMRVHRWEAGKYPPDCMELLKICRLTNREPEYFLKD